MCSFWFEVRGPVYHFEHPPQVYVVWLKARNVIRGKTTAQGSTIDGTLFDILIGALCRACRSGKLIP